MKVPLQVVFEHIAHVDYIEERVRQEAEAGAVLRSHNVGACRSLPGRNIPITRATLIASACI